MLYSFQKFHTYDFISSHSNFSPPLSSLQAALVAQVVKNLSVQEMRVLSLGWEDLLEKGVATNSSILAWRIPRTEEPDGLQSTGLQKVRPPHPCNHSTDNQQFTDRSSRRRPGSPSASDAHSAPARSLESIRQCGVALCIVLGFSILSASIGSSVVRDRVTGAKRLQHVSGLGYRTYWLTHFLFDMVGLWRCPSVSLHRWEVCVHVCVCVCVCVAAPCWPVPGSTFHFPVVLLPRRGRWT